MGNHKKTFFGYDVYTTDGKIHRSNGPAIKYATDEESWALYNRNHRYYGPAKQQFGICSWWIHGVCIK